MNSIELENQFGAKNYHPLPVTLVRGEGAFVWDDKGQRYLDMMSAYSAVSHGHCHPELVAALTRQASTLAVSSRAFYSDQLGGFLAKICQLTGMEKALPMNSGAEAVETAIKAARKWAYSIKKIPGPVAEIIVCENNFHGRTSTIISFSTEEQYRAGFGPYMPGFKIVPYGNAEAIAAAITANTAAVLLEPIQGEAGIIVPPAGYLASVQKLCRQHNVLLMLDEIQTGLGRTGKLLACQHENVIPDGLILGKALGGGLLPVSAFLTNEQVMGVFTPGDHGSTFGGSPLAAAVARTALIILERDGYAERAADLGVQFKQALQACQANTPVIKDVRGKGLFIGLEIDKNIASAREFCLRLLPHGILSKETHDTVVRLAPPLIVSREQLDVAVEKITLVANSF